MNIKQLFHTFICLLSLCASSSAQQTFKPNGKEPGWTYNTIAELHDLAKKHLASLDTQIADKKAASESIMNPLKSIAKKNHDKLVTERKDFLDQSWTCPFWWRCNNCNGGNKQSFVGSGMLNTGPCWKCRRQNGYKYHGDHYGEDKDYSCNPSTIRALLKVAD
jgi:hypothetical protein